jgi:hypothetical protein
MGSANVDLTMGRFGASLSQVGATEARTGVPDEIPSCDPVVIAASSNYKTMASHRHVFLCNGASASCFENDAGNLPA